MIGLGVGTDVDDTTDAVTLGSFVSATFSWFSVGIMLVRSVLGVDDTIGVGGTDERRVGMLVGPCVGEEVGVVIEINVGSCVGEEVVVIVEPSVGLPVVEFVEGADGDEVGCLDGFAVGKSAGDAVGLLVGGLVATSTGDAVLTVTIEKGNDKLI
jgi:hypothetical protein